MRAPLYAKRNSVLIDVSMASWLAGCDVGATSSAPDPVRHDPIAYDLRQIIAYRHKRNPRALDLLLALAFIRSPYVR